MKLLVDGIEVQADYKRLQPRGFILQMLVPNFALFEKLVEKFRDVLPDGGVMDNKKPDQDGFYEIKLMGWTILRTIDEMRSWNHDIKEQEPS